MEATDRRDGAPTAVASSVVVAMSCVSVYGFLLPSGRWLQFMPMTPVTYFTTTTRTVTEVRTNWSLSVKSNAMMCAA